jgi:hypothetical protein
MFRAIALTLRPGLHSQPLISLVMTSQTVIRCVVLRVAVHAKAHAVLHYTLGHGHLRNVSVTGAALNFGTNMRPVVESHMVLIGESVNSLPRNVFAALPHRRDLLDYRVVHCNELMAAHAIPDIGDSCLGSAIHDAGVTGLTRNRPIEMRLMRVRDRLLRFRTDLKEVPDCFED